MVKRNQLEDIIFKAIKYGISIVKETERIKESNGIICAMQNMYSKTNENISEEDKNKATELIEQARKSKSKIEELAEQYKDFPKSVHYEVSEKAYNFFKSAEKAYNALVKNNSKIY